MFSQGFTKRCIFYFSRTYPPNMSRKTMNGFAKHLPRKIKET